MFLYICESNLNIVLDFIFEYICVFILMDFPNELEIKLDSKLSL